MATLDQLDRIDRAGRIAFITNTNEMRRYVKIELAATELGRQAWEALEQDDKEGLKNALRQIKQIGKERNA